MGLFSFSPGKGVCKRSKARGCTCTTGPCSLVGMGSDREDALDGLLGDGEGLDLVGLVAEPGQVAGIVADHQADEAGLDLLLPGQETRGNFWRDPALGIGDEDEV